jgi:hypothetical protein
MKDYFSVRLLFASLLAVGMARSAHVQLFQRGSIGGVVTESSGAVLSNAN